MRENIIEYCIGAALALFALLVVFVVCLGFYACGYAVGAWSVACPFDSSQPKCVQAGWGQHNDVTVRSDHR